MAVVAGATLSDGFLTCKELILMKAALLHPLLIHYAPCWYKARRYQCDETYYFRSFGKHGVGWSPEAATLIIVAGHLKHTACPKHGAGWSPEAATLIIVTGHLKHTELILM